MSRRDELPVVAFLSGLTFGVFVLAGTLLGTLPTRWHGFGWTGPVAGVAAESVPAIVTVPIVTLVGLSITVATHRVLVEARLSAGATFEVVTAVLAVVVALWLGLVRAEFLVVEGVVLIALPFGTFAGVRLGRKTAADVFPGPTGTVLLLTVALVTGAAVAVPGGHAFGDQFTTTAQEMPPHTEFEASYQPGDGDPGILTITHAGGDPIPASQLRVDVEEVRPEEGAAMQNGSGLWAGEATGGGPDERLVVEGDEVTIGVYGDCSGGVYHESDPFKKLATFDCESVRVTETPTAGSPVETPMNTTTAAPALSRTTMPSIAQT